MYSKSDPWCCPFLIVLFAFPPSVMKESTMRIVYPLQPHPALGTPSEQLLGSGIQMTLPWSVPLNHHTILILTGTAQILAEEIRINITRANKKEEA